MAKRAAAQSNLVIKPDERPKFVVEKIADEGTASPFIARLFVGLLNLRTYALSDVSERDRFDKAFEGVMTGVDTIRNECRELTQAYSSHSQKIDRGEGVSVVGDTIQVADGISKELRKRVETVIGTAGRVCKDRMQDVLRDVGVEIGFLYRQQDTFSKEITRLKSSSPDLAEFLTHTRAKWSERLALQRNAIEHQGWPLPRVQYTRNSQKVRAIEPMIDGQPVTEFVTYMVDRVCCFVEELCAHALQAKMPKGISITETPLAERKPEIKERFPPALVGGGMPLWTISYHESRFEEH